MPTATSLMSTYQVVAGSARKDFVLPSLELSFTLLVNEATGEICGQARITNLDLTVTRDSEISIGNVTGHIQATGSGNFTRLVSLQGDAVKNLAPPVILSVYVPFQAQFAIDGSWEGVGGWTLGTEAVDNMVLHASVQEGPEA